MQTLDANAQLEQVTNQLSETQTELENNKGVIEKLMFEKLDLDNELTKSRNNQQSLEDKLAELRRSLEDKESENQVLKAKLKGLQRKVTKDMEKVEKAREELRKAIDECGIQDSDDDGPDGEVSDDEFFDPNPTASEDALRSLRRIRRLLRRHLATYE